MKREVIQDFLNLPGIAGVALIDGRSRPYFCGIDQTLNFQQKEALAQGILQVVETIPDGFEALEFQFADHQVYVYRFDRGMVLLVLTQSNLVYDDYLGTIQGLKALLKEDIPNAIATFRLMAGNITLTGTNYRKAGTDTGKTTITTPTAQSPDVSLPDRSFSRPPEIPPAPPEPVSQATNNSSAATASLSETIAALNDLSRFTTQYLGTHVIVNYWKSTRPPFDGLTALEIDRTAQFSYSGSSRSAPLTSEEQQWLRDWVAAFTKRCAQVIRDFPAIVAQQALNDSQKAILLEPPSGDASA